MKISVITPTYNSAATIRTNVHSVLFQTHQDFEQIIIDNASEDDTTEKIIDLYQSTGKSDKLIIISEPDKGIASAFNKGINIASGDIIGILNSDDRYFNEKVFEQVIKAFEDESVLFVHGDIMFNDPVYGSNIRKPLMCPLTYAMPFNHPTMFFRKEIYDKFGRFDTDYKYAMDFEFICRLNRETENFYSRGVYLKGDPLVVMAAGGASWKSEQKTLAESKKALKKHGLWNKDAKKNYALRYMRIKLKGLLNLFRANALVKLWRKFKWR